MRRRKSWGCDKQTTDERYVYAISCPFCEGNLAACKHCHGTNQIRIDRCPFALVKRVHMDVCSGAVFLESGGVMPAAGGWNEQSPTFIEALTIVLREKAYYDEQRIKRRGSGRT